MRNVRVAAWLLAIVLFVGLAAFVSRPAQADPLAGIYMMSEEFPPYNFKEKGELKGVAAELLQAMIDHLGSSRSLKEVQVLPWARSFDTLLKTPQTMLFAMTRTREREDMFSWVGPIAPNRNVLIARKARKIRIKSMYEVSDYRVGAVPMDAGAQLLIDAEVDEFVIDYANSAKLNVRKLAQGRIDLFAYAEAPAYWVIKQSGLDMRDFETVYVVEDGEVYFALHRSTSDEVVNQLQKALDELRARGVVDEILSRYFPS